MTKKVFLIGGATLDTIITYENMETMIQRNCQDEKSYLLLPEGAKIEVTQQHLYSGGGATNAAVSFARQGYSVGLFCKLGNDTAGSFIRQELDQYNIDTTHIVTTQKQGTSSSFVVPSLSGDRSIFAYRGANTTLLSEDLPLAQIQSSDLIYVTSLSRDSSARLPEIVACAREANVPVAINPGISQLKQGGCQALKQALSGIHTLILNYEEAQAFMLSLCYENEANSDFPATKQLNFSVKAYAKLMIDMGVKVVVVTDGDNGVYVATENKIYFHQALKVDVINTLGAGDAFGSGFVGCFHRGYSIEESIQTGVLLSASVIQHPDAKTGLLSTEAIREQALTLSKDLLREISW